MRLVSVATATAVMSFGAAAQADSPWYLSGDLGGYFRQDATGSITFSKLVAGTTTTGPGGTVTIGAPPHRVTAQGSLRTSFDPGLTGHLALGYRLTPHLRLEAELGMTAYDADKVYPSANSPNFPFLDGAAYTRRSGGGRERLSEEVNAFWDFPTVMHAVTPYAGAGVGVREGRASSGVFTSDRSMVVNGQAVQSPPFDEVGRPETQGFAMVEAGLSLKLSRRWSVVPAYRYVRDFKQDSGRQDDAAHVAKLGVRYAF